MSQQVPAHEYEGPLSSSEVGREHDQREAEARKILRHNRMALCEDPDFLLWFQSWAYPMLAQDFPVDNGSRLASFMGKRALIMQQVKDIEEYTGPGFLSRVLVARDNYEKMLRAAERAEEE